MVASFLVGGGVNAISIEQDGQSTCNVTLMRVCAVITAVKKPPSITQSVCVFVALAIQNAMCIHHIAICGLPHSTTLYLTNCTI